MSIALCFTYSFTLFEKVGLNVRSFMSGNDFRRKLLAND